MDRISSKWDVGKRWTPELVQSGWTPVADVFLRNYAALQITSSEAMLIIHLMQHKWDEDHPFPAFDTLGKRMGMTDTAVRNHARSLEKKGYLKRVQQRGKPNRFNLKPLFAALSKRILAKALPA